jgi:hypothetical protein
LKIKAFAKGIADTGVGNVGYVAVRPNLTSFNDLPAIHYTTTIFPVAAVDFSQDSTAATNSTFNSTDIGPDDAQWRVVACGLRICYQGAELERQGIKVALVDPTHRTVDGRDIASLSSELQAETFFPDRKWTSIVFRPVLTSELTFDGALPAANVTPYMIIAFTTNGAPMSYRWEVFSISEFQGINVRGQTLTHPDPIGFAAVNAVGNTMNGISNTNTPGQSMKQMMKSVEQYIAQGISGVNDVVHGAQSAAQLAS